MSNIDQVRDHIASLNIERTIIILSTFRSGTTYIADLLGQNGVDGLRVEIFNDFYAETFGDYGELDRLRKRIDDGVFGKELRFKIMVPQLLHLMKILNIKIEDSGDFLGLFPEPQIIHVERDNFFDHAVSFYRAKVSDQWFQDENTKSVEVEYDFPRMLELATEIVFDNQIAKDFIELSGADHVTVEYNAFCQDVETSLSSLLQFIGHGVDNQPVTNTALTKQSNRNSAGLRQQFLHDLCTKARPTADAGSTEHAVDGTIAPLLKSLDAKIDAVGRSANEIRQVSGPFGLVIDDKDLLVQTIHGNKYYVDRSDLIMTPQLIVYRQWEAELSRLLPTIAHPGGDFIDVGANFGYFSCLMASHLKRAGSGRVVAFEPNPEMARRLEINRRINWSMAPIEIHQNLVGDVPGVASLNIPMDRAANASIVAADTELDPNALQVELEMVTLDTVIDPSTKVGLIKIDVEGYEPNVVKGAMDTIQRAKCPIVFEWSLAQLAEAGQDDFSWIEALSALGYTFYNADRYLGDPEPQALDLPTLQQVPYMNVLALVNS